MYRITRIALALLTFGCLLVVSAAAEDQNQLSRQDRYDVAALCCERRGAITRSTDPDVDLVFGVHPAGIAMVVSGEAVMTNYTLERPCRPPRKMGR